MGKSLASKVVVICGASSGIGAATALSLARQGAHLVLGARRMDKLEEVAAQARALGAQVFIQSCDVAKQAQVQDLTARAVREFGRLDVMLANAGYGYLAQVHEMDEKAWDEIFQVNVKGTWYAMKAAAEVMIPQGSGHIIVVSSAAARRGLPLYGVYSATKAAQLSLAEAMRVELSDRGVYVSSVHPATTATEFFDTAATLSGVPNAGLGKAMTAEKVADKIVRLMINPRPELWPHGAVRLGLSFSTLLPGMTDKALKKTLPRRSPPTKK